MKRFIFYSLILTILSLTACSGTRATDVSPLPSSPSATDSCDTPIYEFPGELYPFTDHCLDLGYGSYHYFDEAPSGTAPSTVLMVHGNPTTL
jgi:hypothetical protein